EQQRVETGHALAVQQARQALTLRAFRVGRKGGAQFLGGEEAVGGEVQPTVFGRLVPDRGFCGLVLAQDGDTAVAVALLETGAHRQTLAARARQRPPFRQAACATTGGGAAVRDRQGLTWRGAVIDVAHQQQRLARGFGGGEVVLVRGGQERR